VFAEVTSAVPDTVILPVDWLYTALPVFTETVPPEMFTSPVDWLCTALPVVAETVPPDMVSASVELK